MTRIRAALLCIGSIKTAWLREGIAEYEKRLQGSLEIIEIPASKEKEADRQKSDESVRLLSALGKREGLVWVLDVTGKHLASATFAHDLGAIADRGDSITFVLGGAYGLTDEVRQRADRIMRLSDMTLPHELCRLVFLEQLYRAGQIRRGTGYHH
ncbi:MAG TPA: 23S rRNA (pseudouridine(1915)-N(3))-methyltransferase RlmH [Candidatus Peribacteraceae bacterium]|nr:23S rRNA (pseudouridine(1915)-N(3))-methyltransferase RlmH [Candidatus Peribacteraceae bacterium]